MDRRRLFGALAAVAAAPLVATGETPPQHVQFSHVAYGARPYSSLGPYVEWRDRIWWRDERGRLRWAFAARERMAENTPDLDWIQPASIPIWQLAPDRDRLWMLTPRGWFYLTFAGSPSDNTACVVCALAR